MNFKILKSGHFIIEPVRRKLELKKAFNKATLKILSEIIVAFPSSYH